MAGNAASPMVEHLGTNSDRTVSLRIDLAGHRYVHKELTGENRLVSNELLDMAEQWRRVEALTGSRLYPRIRELDRTHVALEHYDLLSIDRCTDLDRAHRLLGRSLVELLSATVRLHDVGSGVGTSAFLANELRIRLDRLRGVAHRLPRPLRPIVSDCDRFSASAGMERLRDRVVPVAVHGDLGLNNVVHDTRGRLAFIDTRARWTPHGLPVWDVALDLASLFIFTTEIQPALASLGFGHASPLHGSQHALLRTIEDTVEASGWGDLDPDWRRRFSIGCIIRLIGSIGVNLHEVGPRTTERTEAVVALTSAFLGRTRAGAMPPWD